MSRQWERATITTRKAPFNPFNKQPFGITTYLETSTATIRVYQGVSGDLLAVDVEEYDA